jgi:hypothetical protein
VREVPLRSSFAALKGLVQPPRSGSTEQEPDIVGAILALAIAIISIQVLVGLAVYLFFGKWNEAGVFGDAFGAVNALFSGLALAGVIVAIFLQRIELRYQREELGLTREELHGQREELASQSVSMRRQTVESTFFQLLSLLNEIARTIKANAGTNTPYDGYQAFYVAANQLTSRYVNTGPFEGSDKIKHDSITAIFRDVCLSDNSDFGHYFRTLYHIIKFVDSSEEIKDKHRYTAFVRAQLSAPVLTLLFFNGLSEFGRYKFKKLVETYALLEHMPEPDPIPRLKYLYEDSAFGTPEK